MLPWSVLQGNKRSSNALDAERPQRSPCSLLHKPVKPQQEAPSWAKELNERSCARVAQLCCNSGKCPLIAQSTPLPDSGTKAPAPFQFHESATEVQPHTDFSKQIITVWKCSWWARTRCIDDWGRWGGSTLHCYLEKDIWWTKSEQGIFQADLWPI